MINNVKTPLSYPGGKSRFLKQLNENTPNLDKVNYFYDLFLGGGSYPIYITKKYPRLKIYVNDSNKKLINFWQQLQTNQNKLVEKLIFIKKNNDKSTIKKQIYELRNDKINNKFDQAVAYYVTNKCSYAGTTESGGFSNWNYEKKFNLTNINKLLIIHKHIKNWHISNLDYKSVIIKSNSFIYLDPPYNIKANLYGKNGNLHKNFNFKEFIQFTQNINEKVLISFNNDDLIKSYNNWIVNSFDHTYLMQTNKDYIKNQKKRKEIILKNYE